MWPLESKQGLAPAAAEAAVTSLPYIGSIASAGLAARDLNEGHYVDAGLNALGILPFVPALAGIIKKAPADIFAQAHAIKNEGIRDGMTEADAIRHAFHKTGVDLTADRNFNYDVTGLENGKNSLSITSKDYGIDGVPISVGDVPTLGLHKHVNGKSSVVIDRSLLKDFKKAREVIEHELQHAHDMGVLSKKEINNYRKTRAKLDKKVERLKKHRKKSRDDYIAYAKAINARNRHMFGSHLERRARTAQMEAHLPLHQRTLISERMKKQLQAIEPLVQQEKKKLVKEYKRLFPQKNRSKK